MNVMPSIGVPSFKQYIRRFSETLDHLFNGRDDLNRISINRGVPPYILNEIQNLTPLAYSIPSHSGGKGARPHEILSVLEACGYESLALSLIMGINGALFLEPVAKFGTEKLKSRVFHRFLHERSMGGLMITEPDFGTNALAMETAHVRTADGYAIEGEKHWAGLTGSADFWLMTARARNADGSLRRDVDFFVCDSRDPNQVIHVKEFYNNLGLFMIPYGLNEVNVEVPEDSRLEPETNGIRLMMDLLHRSRMRFPGMAIGFVRRIMDEAIKHCRERKVSGIPLLSYDQVQKRLSQLQAWFTTCSAFCKHSGEISSIDNDLTGAGLEANIHKAVMSDIMHDAAQSFLQLVGAKGYRHDHIAGRAFIDSRPFQIFEGSNDVIYSQIADATLKLMHRAKEANLQHFLAVSDFASKAAESLRCLLNFTVDNSLNQRRRVDLGRIVSRAMAMNLIIGLGEGGFNKELIANAVEMIREEIAGLAATCLNMSDSSVVEDYQTDHSWQLCMEPA